MAGALTDGAFHGVAPHRVHSPSGFRLWFTEPLGLLTQVGERTDADDDVARFIIDAQAELDRQRPTPRLLYLHDWRRLTSYTPGARRMMTVWGLSVRERAESIVIALAPDATALRVGVGFAGAALKMVGFSVLVVDDLEATVEARGVRPARR